MPTTRQHQFPASLQKRKDELTKARQQMTLFHSPLRTLYHFSFVLLDWSRSLLLYLLSHTILLLLIFALCSLYIIGKLVDGEHRYAIEAVEGYIELTAWWMVLGILSSVGLGTGLHTFVLYLGPYIAKVTMAASACGSLRFPTTGPDSFICTDDTSPTGLESPVTFIDILQNIALVCFLWGFGTAIGELPPYFVSRAAARSGKKDAETLKALDTLTDNGSSVLGWLKERFFHILQNHSFPTIILFASVPNPLFDLAGVTCGHFGVPFFTFFSATFIGKAIVKVALQSSFVVVMFHRDNLERLIETIESVLPRPVCEKIDASLREAKANFHRATGSGSRAAAPRTLVARCWDALLILMLAFFLKSIIESSVRERLEKRDQDELDKLKSE